MNYPVVVKMIKAGKQLSHECFNFRLTGEKVLTVSFVPGRIMLGAQVGMAGE
jgi:hypothetical protein